jgi:superfamily I DNA and RNA helicase
LSKYSCHIPIIFPLTIVSLAGILWEYDAIFSLKNITMVQPMHLFVSLSLGAPVVTSKRKAARVDADLPEAGHSRRGGPVCWENHGKIIGKYRNIIGNIRENYRTS